MEAAGQKVVLHKSASERGQDVTCRTLWGVVLYPINTTIRLYKFTESFSSIIN
jgi:hypothetical protein